MYIGHEKTAQYFDRLIQKNNLAHAYLFVGPEGVGKTGFAENLGMKLFCSEAEGPCGQCVNCRSLSRGVHPDLIAVEPESETDSGKTKKSRIGIGQIKELQKKLSFFPYQANRKIALIKEAEFITEDAANSLLKTLEEPSSSSMLILISSFPEMILPTLVSRCQTVNFSFLSGQKMEEFADSRGKMQKLEPAEAEIVRLLSVGRPGFLDNFLKNSVLRKFLLAQAAFFKDVFNKDLSEIFSEVKKLAENQEKLKWALFVWLTLGRSLLIGSGKGDKKFQDRAFCLMKELQTNYLFLTSSSLNRKLILENIFYSVLCESANNYANLRMKI